jgi:hypothetical protein
MIKYNAALGVYLAKGEAKLAEFISPSYFVHRCISTGRKIEDWRVLNFLQDELRELLHSFLNGGFSYGGFLLYPVVKDISAENRKRMKAIFNIVAYLRNKGYDFSRSISAFKKFCVSSRNFSILLSLLYREWSNAEKEHERTARKRPCRQLSEKDYKDSSYVRPLFDLKRFAEKELKKHLLGFYLHGSLSTRDYVKGWSDLDTLAIVSKKALNSCDALLSLRDLLYKSRIFSYRIDPLQHHGHIIATEYDLEHYAEAYFPVTLFNYASSFFGSDKAAAIKIRNSDAEKVSRLFYFVNYFRHLYLNKRCALGSYETKFLLHAITLFPTLYLQAKGISLYKKFSFSRARKDFSEDEWAVVREVELIRKRWSFGVRNFTGGFARINPLLAYRINAKLADFSSDVGKSNSIDTKKIIEKMFHLSESAWEKIKCRIS